MLQTVRGYLVRNPAQFIVGAMHHLGVQLNRRLHSAAASSTGVEVVDEDWDNLLILDGCRHDLYCEVRGDVSSKHSLGTTSWSFLKKNFQERQLHDTVYVSANPFTEKLDPETFHAVVDLYGDQWDPMLETVTPETVTDAALDAWQEYPDKRLVVHYMQPHFPFIGPTGRELRQGGLTDATEDEFDLGDKTLWTQLQYGLNDLDRETVWRAYRENLELAVESAERFHYEADGKSVLTSDHGNLVGDWTGPIPARGYGHPTGLFVPGLVRVPWEVLPGNRRRITKDEPKKSSQVRSNVVDDRLRKLGYK